MAFDRPSVAQEQELLVEILSFADDPVGFTLFNYPWGEKNTPLEHVKGPRDWQLKEIEELGRHTRQAHFAHDNELQYEIWKSAWSSGRGPGKSGAFGILAHWHISTHLGAHTIVAANTETQLRTKTFPELAKWVTLGLNRHWFNVEGIKITPEAWFSDLLAKQLKIDARYHGIFGQTWSEENPDAFAGAHVPYGLMVLFDEAAGIPAGVWNVAEGFFTDPGPYRFWLAASQMRRASGRFFDLFFSPAFQTQWRTRMIDIRQIKEIDQTWVQNFIDSHGGVDSDEVRVEIRGMPPKQGAQQFISPEEVNGARQRVVYPDPGEPLIMGVDPAPRGRTVIRFRQGRDARSIPRVVLQAADNTEIADEIVRLTNRYNPDAIVIDGGMGTGVIDNLKRLKVKCHEVWFGSGPLANKEFLTRGTELWAKVRDWLPGGAIDDSDELFNDMVKREWKWAGREENRKVLESKADMAARGIPSPDDMDALCLTFHVNPPRRDKHASRAGGRPGQPQRQDDSGSLFKGLWD